MNYYRFIWPGHNGGWFPKPEGKSVKNSWNLNGSKNQAKSMIKCETMKAKTD